MPGHKHVMIDGFDIMMDGLSDDGLATCLIRELLQTDYLTEGYCRQGREMEWQCTP